MTEDLDAGFRIQEHTAEQKYVLWGPITKPAFRDFVFYTGRRWSRTFTESEMADIQAQQAEIPVLLLQTEKAGWWTYQDKIYRHAQPLDEPVAARGFIIQHHRSKSARLERARRLGEQGENEAST